MNMFNQNLQAQIVQEELRQSQRQRYIHSKKKLKTEKFSFLREKARAYLVVFLKTSSIHGLNHMVTAGRHRCEILLWLVFVAMSVFGSVYLSQTTWIRYQSSPTVISMDRDMFAWNTTFPSVTICPKKKIDEKKLEQYLEASSVSNKKELKKFIETLAYGNYKSFEQIPDYNEVPPEQFMELLVNLSMHFAPSLTIGQSGVHLIVQPTITEMGLCHAINSKVAVYNSPSYRSANRWDLIKTEEETFFVHPLDGEVFAQVVNLSTAYDAYIHGPLEMPDISTKYQYSDEDFYMKLYVTALTVYTSPEAARLSVKQRRCRFPHENVLRHSAVYTYNACRMECRARLALQRCRCLPHFYRRTGNERVCNVSGLHCLAKYTDVLYTLRDIKGNKVHCDCLPTCDDVNYVIQSYVLQEWFLGTNFQWGIVTYPRMRYRRDIIFGFTDVLVAVGSMAGLFLGCSVLSFMEIVYFLTLRLIFYIYNSCKST